MCSEGCSEISHVGVTALLSQLVGHHVLILGSVLSKQQFYVFILVMDTDQRFCCKTALKLHFH